MVIRMADHRINMLCFSPAIINPLILFSGGFPGETGHPACARLSSVHNRISGELQVSVVAGLNPLRPNH
jgi:hypothetical protein